MIIKTVAWVWFL